MLLDEITTDVLLARGKYSTVNGEHKRLMSNAQAMTQTACDALRHALQSDDHDKMRSLFESARDMAQSLADMSSQLADMKAQKDALWNEAWGKK
jgi:hypothetical protein